MSPGESSIPPQYKNKHSHFHKQRLTKITPTQCDHIDTGQMGRIPKRNSQCTNHLSPLLKLRGIQTAKVMDWEMGWVLGLALVQIQTLWDNWHRSSRHKHCPGGQL